MPAFVETLENRQLMASGTLDPSFGSTGTLTSRIAVNAGTGEGAVGASQVLVDSGGRVLTLARTSQAITLYRLTEVGKPDPSFAAATGGRLRIELPKALQRGGGLNDVRIQQDDANRTYILIGPQVIRLTSSGKVDRSYGRRGNAMLSNLAGANDFVVQGDGRAYVVGTLNVAGTQATRMSVMRLTATGAVDPSFFEKGTATATITTPSNRMPSTRGKFIRMLADGGILALGSASATVERDFGLATGTGAVALKFLSNGEIDATYGRKGRGQFVTYTSDVTFPTAAPVAIRSDGSYVLYTTASSDDISAGAATANLVIPSNGSESVSDIDLTPGTDGAVANGRFVLDANVFPGDALNGSEFFVDPSSRTLTRFNYTSTSGYALDTTFNGGQPILGPQTVVTTGGGAIVFAGTGSSNIDNRLTVGRVFATEAPSVQASIPPLTKPAADAVVSVRLRDDDGVIFDQTDGVPTGAVLNGPAGPIPGRLVLGTNAELRFAFAGLGGTWDRSENGAYTVDINFNDLVRGVSGAGDAGGEENFIGTKRVGKLIVAIA
ncbi:MAG TPA: hypothetical protein VF624_16325 [Tepidisphaeraceae bacterium]|jgi:uncharacterized delta-60 repeat protein